MFNVNSYYENKIGEMGDLYRIWSLVLVEWITDQGD